MSEDYKVQLDSYSGPLDLLLYLIRQEEVDIYHIPIARVTQQYLAYVDVLEKLDPNHIGEFLVLAATLMEIKSRMLLPTPPPEEQEDDLEDPRLDLVRQLLEYKKFKDAAAELGAAAEQRALRFGRLPVLPAAEGGGGEVDVEDVQIWDLVSAFSKLLRQIGLADKKHEVLYDETPIALHATDIIDYLQREGGSARFEQLFAGRSKSQIIGLFLALELIRAKRVRAEQESTLETLILHLLDARPLLQTEIAQGSPGVGPGERTES